MARFDFFRRMFRSFDSQSWIQDWFRGRDVGNETFSGISISPERAFNYSAVFACSKILAEGIASVPLIIYKRLTGGGKERATDHPLYNILHLKPNPEKMTSFSFREMQMLHLIFWGNSYSEIQEDESGNTIALWPLLPWKMTVFRDPNWGIIYKYRLPDNTETIIPKSKVLHIPGISFDGLVGKSLISAAREAIGLGIALEEFGARFFGQGTQFGGFLEHPRTLSPEAENNLRAALKEKYKGIANSHRIIILEEGMKFSKNNIPPNDAQFIESRKFQLNEICRIFNVNPNKVKDLDRATFSNIEEQNIEHVTDTLRPWCVRIEQSETIQLLTEPEIKVYFIEHLLEGILRGKSEERFTAYNIARMGGWMNADEIRELENMNPLPNGQGKIYWMPLNMIDANKVNSIIPSKPTGQDNLRLIEPKELESREFRGAVLKSRIATNYRGLFEEATSRIIALEKYEVLKAAKSIFGKRNINLLNFTEFLEKFYTDRYGAIDKHMKPIINTYGKVIADTVSDEIDSVVDAAKLDGFMEEYSEAFNKRYIASSKNRLNEAAAYAIENDLDPYGQIENKFNDWESTRPQTVSLKETIKIAGAVSLFTYAAGGIQRIMWVNTGSKSCPFCESLNGRIVGTEQPYAFKDGSMEAEGKEPLTFSSNIMHPPLHGGCMCMLSPA